LARIPSILPVVILNHFDCFRGQIFEIISTRLTVISRQNLNHPNPPACC